MAVAACGTGPCDAELDTCFADGQPEGACWFQYDACFFGDAYGPCEDDLGACLDGGGDPDALRDAAAAWKPQAAWQPLEVVMGGTPPVFVSLRPRIGRRRRS